ncbi:MAG: hypothetical protein KTR28_06955 [Micavibrio sp.]|nr:hypothetical protein [Micavibrio sp.]
MSAMPQSTNHVLMIEPAEFYANPQTSDTNAYQAEGGEPSEAITKSALKEFYAFREKLLAHGVKVTTGKGIIGSPDMIFPNWFFTHASGELILCPMLNENRRAERTGDLIDLLSGLYPDVKDWTDTEIDNRALESTASIVSDHINKRCYAALSGRTDEALVHKWAEYRGYEPMIFDTRSHAGIPVYHTDCIMWIGTTLAGVCDPVIVGDAAQQVVERLNETHKVVRFTAEQLRTFSGNALEVKNAVGERFLAISQGAVDSLSPEQLAIINEHFDGIISSPLDTMEKFGGGSARCMLAELF